MRAWFGEVVIIAMVAACGASTASPSDAGSSNTDLDGAYGVPDGRTHFGDSMSKMLYPVGGQCMHSSDCLSNNCNHDYDGFPGGYCVQDCSVGRYGPQPCPMGSSCTILNADSPTCYLSCNADTDCRTGYQCLDIGSALTQTGPSKICWPTGLMTNCNVNSDCPPSMPHCTGGYNPAEAGAGDGGDSGGGGDDGGPPMPGVGNCGP
jgi:hypothetical protein